MNGNFSYEFRKFDSGIKSVLATDEKYIVGCHKVTDRLDIQMVKLNESRGWLEYDLSTKSWVKIDSTASVRFIFMAFKLVNLISHSELMHGQAYTSIYKSPNGTEILLNATWNALTQTWVIPEEVKEAYPNGFLTFIAVANKEDLMHVSIGPSFRYYSVVIKDAQGNYCEVVSSENYNEVVTRLSNPQVS